MSTNQDLDEGQSGDPRAVRLAEIRASIRALITDQYGNPSWTKADALGKQQVPTMAAATIVKFASGYTRQPSIWTIRTMAEVVGYDTVFVLKGQVLPPGSIKT